MVHHGVGARALGAAPLTEPQRRHHVHPGEVFGRERGVRHGAAAKRKADLALDRGADAGRGEAITHAPRGGERPLVEAEAPLVHGHFRHELGDDEREIEVPVAVHVPWLAEGHAVDAHLNVTAMGHIEPTEIKLGRFALRPVLNHEEPRHPAEEVLGALGVGVAERLAVNDLGRGRRAEGAPADHRQDRRLALRRAGGGVGGSSRRLRRLCRRGGFRLRLGQRRGGVKVHRHRQCNWPGLAPFGAGSKMPLLHRGDGFAVKRRAPRVGDLHVRHRAVGGHRDQKLNVNLTLVPRRLQRIAEGGPVDRHRRDERRAVRFVLQQEFLLPLLVVRGGARRHQ